MSAEHGQGPSPPRVLEDAAERNKKPREDESRGDPQGCLADAVGDWKSMNPIGPVPLDVGKVFCAGSAEKEEHEDASDVPRFGVQHRACKRPSGYLEEATAGKGNGQICPEAEPFGPPEEGDGVDAGGGGSEEKEDKAAPASVGREPEGGEEAQSVEEEGEAQGGILCDTARGKGPERFVGAVDLHVADLVEDIGSRIEGGGAGCPREDSQEEPRIGGTWAAPCAQRGDRASRHPKKGKDERLRPRQFPEKKEREGVSAALA